MYFRVNVQGVDIAIIGQQFKVGLCGCCCGGNQHGLAAEYANNNQHHYQYDTDGFWVQFLVAAHDNSTYAGTGNWVKKRIAV